MEFGVWRYCTEDEIISVKPVAPITINTTPAETAALNQEFKDDLRHYSEFMHRNNRAIGTISNLIEADKLVHIEGKVTVEEAWEALKTKHADTYCGLAAFYTKVRMLAKGYTEGENMHSHLTFFTTESLEQKHSTMYSFRS